MSLFTRLVVAATEARPVEKLMTQTRPGLALAHRFVAGDTLDEAVDVARTLNAEGMQVSLDLLGEEVTDLQSAETARDEYMECLDRIASDRLDANISVKLTQLGLSIDSALASESIDLLAKRAADIGTTVTIDMEDSRFTAATVDLYEDAQRRHGNLGIALQAYLHRTPEDLRRLSPLGGHIRLCKGAYVEPPAVALTTRREVNAAFASLLGELMASPETKPAVATHDQDLVNLARRLAADRSHPYEFQMLYGVKPSLQRQLVADGHSLRVYLPFGSQWYPYLTRRLAERPANAWFFVKSLFS